MARYAMNLNDGRLVFNSSAVATNINYVEIDDEIFSAITEGKVAWQIVANAVKAKRNNDPNFDWTEYDFLRDRLNVRKAKFDLKDGDGKDVTGVGGAEDKSINPSVSFVELNRVDKGGASTADNTNVGAPPVNPFDAPVPAPASEMRKTKVKVNV